MEVLSSRKMVWMVMMMTTTMTNMAKSELHYVGGSKYGWAPNVNLSEWSSHQHFHVQDWLYFGYDKHMYNVLEVNETSYENCIDAGFIQNITRGGRDVFQLTEARPYYFLSGGGFCWNGLKIAINVTEDFPPSPQPAPPGSNSTSDCCGIEVHQPLMVLILALMWGILFK